MGYLRMGKKDDSDKELEAEIRELDENHSADAQGDHGDLFGGRHPQPRHRRHSDG